MKCISIKLDKTFNVLEDRSKIDQYEYLAETTKEVVYTPKDNYRFLILDKQEEKHAYRSTLGKISISEIPEGDFWNKHYGECYSIRVYTEEPLNKVEKKINKEFQKWLNAKLAKYGASTTINIKLSGLEK